MTPRLTNIVTSLTISQLCQVSICTRQAASSPRYLRNWHQWRCGPVRPLVAADLHPRRRGPLSDAPLMADVLDPQKVPEEIHVRSGCVAPVLSRRGDSRVGASVGSGLSRRALRTGGPS